jgi:hypothetical protein
MRSALDIETTSEAMNPFLHPAQAKVLIGEGFRGVEAFSIVHYTE